MRIIPGNRNTGLTLIEVMVVVVIVVVAALGAMQFRYACVADAKRADVQINAARVGAMLLDTWKGMGGLTTYNPSIEFPLATYGSQYEILTSTSGLDAPTDFMPLANKYLVRDKASNAYYYVTLSYKPATSTPQEPLALNAIVVWRNNYSAGAVTSNDRTIKMTTYVN